MSDVSFGLIVSGVVVLVVLVVATVTAMYCKWVERSEDKSHIDKFRAA